MERVLNFALLFGLGVLALLILFLAGLLARGRVTVILAGIASSVLMALECLLLYWTAGIASATSTSQQGDELFRGAVAVFALSLAIYFPLAIAKLNARKSRKPR